MSIQDNNSNLNITVTSALPYANGEIHIGHIVSTYLPADVFTRYSRLNGFNVIHVCATDDFGTPNLIQSEKEGKTPEEYVKYWHYRDLEDFKKLGISFDYFHQTSSKENIELTQEFFRKLLQNNHIFNKKIHQPYCENDKKFLPDRYVVGTCPICRTKDQYSDGCEKCGRTLQSGEILEPHCSICGSVPVMRESIHYFFRLSAFSEKLKKWLQTNQGLKPEIKNYVLNWIKNGLKDWDITRDIKWGVPIPLKEARGKVLYGWFDNHLCYISSAVHYLSGKGLDGKSFWNSSKIYHFIGKDIIYHHYLFLPAMRMGVEEEYKLPDFIPVRGHLMLQGKKISKSRDWYISLRDFLNGFPADYLRYYCSAITPYSQDDVNFDWDEFHAKINNELVANVGNFINRILSFIKTRYSGEVPFPEEYSSKDIEFINKIRDIPKAVSDKLEHNENSEALRLIMDFSAQCNQYFQLKEPWTNKPGSSTCLYLCSNAVRTLSILLTPYLPSSTVRIWSQMGLEGSVHETSWNSSSELQVKQGHKIGNVEILFRKLEDEEIESYKKKLGKHEL